MSKEEKKAEKIALWIFKASYLDEEEETWNSMVIEEVTERIRRILEEEPISSAE